jgi:hypothetical protein
MNTPGPDLIGVGGGIRPRLIFGEARALASSHLSNGDTGSTQILTRHFSVQPQTVSQLTELGDYAF